MYQDILKEMKLKMEKTAEHFKSEIASLRTGRATPSLVDNIKLNYYGQIMTVNQVASISAPQSNTLIIQPWDKNAIEPLQKAIMESQLGISPVVDKDMIRLVLPALSQERREALIKVLDQKMEEAKVSIRKEREDSLKHFQAMKEDGELREDDFFKAKDEVQKIIDEFNNVKLKNIRDQKEKEILTS